MAAGGCSFELLPPQESNTNANKAVNAEPLVSLAGSEPIIDYGLTDLPEIRGNPKAVPPILPRARASDRAAIRATEAREGQAFYYHPPADARYSSAVFDVFDAQRGAGS